MKYGLNPGLEWIPLGVGGVFVCSLLLLLVVIVRMWRRVPLAGCAEQSIQQRRALGTELFFRLLVDPELRTDRLQLAAALVGLAVFVLSLVLLPYSLAPLTP